MLAKRIPADQKGLATAASALIFCLLLAPEALAQQNPDFLFDRPNGFIMLRGQQNLQRAQNLNPASPSLVDLYELVTRELTLEKSDFNGAGIALEFGRTLTPRIDLRTGVDFTSAFARSEFRDFTDMDDLPIEQDTSLRQVDLFASFEFALTSRGRMIGQYSYVPSRFVPYVGGGGGFLWYRFQQSGDFVDFMDMAVFRHLYKSDGWTPSGHAFGGVHVRITPNVSVTGEVRQIWADAELNHDDFSNFTPIDLSGLRIGVGIRFVF